MAEQAKFLPDVKVERDHGWVTIVLPLLQHKEGVLPDKTKVIAFEFGGLLGGKPVASTAMLATDWQESKSPDVPVSFWWSDLSIERSGSPSDQLVKEIAALYDIKKEPVRAKEAVQFRVVSVITKPDSSRKVWKLKIFFDSDKPDEYAEAYFNVDFSAKTVTLAEKDPEYRSAMIKALGVFK